MKVQFVTHLSPSFSAQQPLGTSGYNTGHCRYLIFHLYRGSTGQHSLPHPPLISVLPLQISEIVGYEIKPTDTTCLANMLEFGFGKFVEK